MKAVLYTGDGSICVGDRDPAPPGVGQVQVRVAYCGVCGTDLHIFAGHMDRRVSKPLVLGHEMAGVIAAVGPGVEGWAVGDRVTVRPLDACGQCPACHAGHAHICMNLKFLGIDSPGAMQETWNVPAHTLHRLPAALPLERAALIEPLAVAVHDVRLGGVAPGEYVVVQGGGPIGLLVALVAQRAGGRVLLTEVNPHRLAFARGLGFAVANPLEEDVAQRVHGETDGAGADVVFEVSGSAAGAEMMTKLPRTRGRVVVVAIFAEPVRVDLFRFFWRELRLLGARVYEPQDFDEAIAIAAAGDLPLDRLISRVVGMSDAEACFRELRAGSPDVKVLVECAG